MAESLLVGHNFVSGICELKTYKPKKIVNLRILPALVSSRVRFGFQFSGFSVSIIQNYFLRATLQLRVNSWGPLKFTCPCFVLVTPTVCYFGL